MTKWYVMRIKAGKMTFEEVSKRWRDKVKAELEKEQTDEE